MDFQYNYNLHGSDRKPLIEAVSQMIGQPAVYQGAPSFSYIIGDYTVDRDGMLSCSSNTHPASAAALVEDLRKRGFVAESVTAEDTAVGEKAMEEPGTEKPAAQASGGTGAEENTVNETAETEPDADAPTAFTVEVPDTGFTPETRENLKKIIASKETLLKRALGADSLPVAELDGRIAFPWFTLHGLDGEADAYSRLVAAICNMAKKQKRVTATEKPAENAKFTMRLFLIRLGFIGDEYKTARRILLKNLTGNSSWKSGHPPVREAESPTVPPDPATAALPSDEAPADSLPMETENQENKPPKADGGDAYGK